MAVKTRNNLLHKIMSREMNGTFQRSSLFKKCPERFCVPLRSLVAAEQLQRGHVFLGFTKCGQYMLSYQLNVLPQYSFPLLLFQYTLHWWQFCLRKPLKLIRSVPLFAGEEVDSDLHLIVSQSMDESRVVVCGISHGNREEPSHMCYITICAAPPKRQCAKCQESFTHVIFGQTSPCLEHSFAVHFKYILLPPFPLFNPSVCLQMDGVLLFNTTDSLLALNIVASSAEEERKFCRKLPFKLKETSDCLRSSQSINSSCASSQNLPSSAEVVQAEHEFESVMEDDANTPNVTTDRANTGNSCVIADDSIVSSLTGGDENASSWTGDNSNIPSVAGDDDKAISLADDENIPSTGVDENALNLTGDDHANTSSMKGDDGNSTSSTSEVVGVSHSVADENTLSMTANDASESNVTTNDESVSIVAVNGRNAFSETVHEANVSHVTFGDGNASSMTVDNANISSTAAGVENISSVTTDENVPSATFDNTNGSSLTADENVPNATADDADVSSVTASDASDSSVTFNGPNISTAASVGRVLQDASTELVQRRSCDEQSVAGEFTPSSHGFRVLENSDQEQGTPDSAVHIADNGFKRPPNFSSAKGETGCGELGDHPDGSGECINQEQRINRGEGTDFRPNEEDNHTCSQVEPEGSDYHRRNSVSDRLDSSLDGSTTCLEVEPDRVLTTCSCKIFTEDLSLHGSVDDTSSFYELETVLPVTVTKLPPSAPLSCVCVHNAESSYTAFENDLSRYTSPFVIISQVSLDLEKCICELVESHEALRTRYKSLRDYDTEIIAVCPHTAEVIVLMKILVYARGPGTTTSFGLPVSPSPSLKSTGFVFSWNIHTGQVKSLHNMALHDFSEKKHNFKFNLAASEAAELWRKVSVPRSVRSRVQAFSNHTVFGGKSLKYLKHPNLPFAVVLQ